MALKFTKNEEKSRVYQWGFDFTVDAGDPSSFKDIETAINKALDGIPGITVVGSMKGDTSWTQKEYGLAPSRNGDDFVGAQKFTYDELKAAWNELKRNVEEDPENKKYPPSHGYDIGNGYDTSSHYSPSYTGEWNINGFSLEEIIKGIEAVDELITAGDLEVMWCDADSSTSDDHGIYIIDGKIDRIY